MFNNEKKNSNGIQAIIRLTSDYALYQEALQRESTVYIYCMSSAISDQFANQVLYQLWQISWQLKNNLTIFNSPEFLCNHMKILTFTAYEHLASNNRTLG